MRHSNLILLPRILDALAPESDALDEHDDCDSSETASVIITSSGRPPSAILGTHVSNYARYRHKLEPLIELEDRLIRMLSSPEEEPDQLGPQQPHWQKQHFSNEHPISPSRTAYPSAPNGRPSPTIMIPHKQQTYSPPASLGSNNNPPSPSNGSLKGKEVMIRTSTNWKKMFALGSRSKSPKSPHSGEIEGWWEDPDDPVHVLNACGPTMSDLWRDKQVRARLEEKRLRLEESSGLCEQNASPVLSISLTHISPVISMKSPESQRRNIFLRMVGSVFSHNSWS